MLHMETARCKEREGDVKAAKYLFLECLKIFPKNVEVHLNLAKLIRFNADSQENLKEVQDLLEAALEFSKKEDFPKKAELAEIALNRLVLLLCQENQNDTASRYLSAHGYTYRLSSPVLRYQKPEKNLRKKTANQSVDKFVQAVDGALPATMLEHMKDVFGNQSQFWVEHDYNSETTGYFSYLHSLNSEPENSMDQIIHHLHKIAIHHFPAVKDAKFAEWWAHCRAHPSGHQLHFDSDDEGRGGVRNPIVSTVICVEGGVGGPTLVTTQKISDNKLAKNGWLVFPEDNRFVMFDGSVLHGVIPGRSVILQSASTSLPPPRTRTPHRPRRTTGRSGSR